MQKIRRSPLWLCCFLVWSCSQQPDSSSKAQTGTPGPLRLLSDEVAETSGLVCLDDGKFLTLNDSGNPPTLFQLDAMGRIQNRTDTTATNQDWEALALHQGELWIADIGNNSGQRTELQLYHAPLTAVQTNQLSVDALTVQYPQAALTKAMPYQHDLDAEALVSTGEQLLLFSKNWLGMQSQVYVVDTKARTSVLKPAGSTTALPGLITDAVYSAEHQVFVVTGYQNFRLNPLPFMLSGDFSPFLAVLDAKFRLVTSVPVESGGQLEAVCLDKAHNIWLSQEKSTHRPAALWRWGRLDALLATAK